MKKELKIPAMGESISEVIIGQILSPTGSNVQMDSEILEMETDKVNQILYAPAAGHLLLSVKTGERIKVGQVIGVIEGDQDQEKIKTPNIQFKEEIDLATPHMKSEEQESLQYTKENFLEELKEKTDTQKETPFAQRNRTLIDKRETRRPLSKIRQVIAKRLVEAQQTTAMLTTFNEVDMTPIIELREKYKEAFQKKYGSKLGFMSFFVKAVISALEAYPQINSSIADDEIIERHYYDIGVAIGTEKGVIVPIVRQAESLSYAEIEKAIENYAKKAREGKLTIDDLQGGGFTITNGGTYGSLLSTPILIPPQCAILGMHKIEKRPIVIDDQIRIRSMMYLALSYDHRIVDGKEAVSFLVHIKNMLEDTSRMLLEI